MSRTSPQRVPVLEPQPEYVTPRGDRRAGPLKNWKGEGSRQHRRSYAEIQEHLYPAFLKTFDEGYPLLILGGEKLWILNKTLAERLLPHWPGKKVLIPAYAVAERPSKTFTRLPENLMVRLRGPNESDCAEGGHGEVAAGFSARLCNRGVHPHEAPSTLSGHRNRRKPRGRGTPAGGPAEKADMIEDVEPSPRAGAP